MIGYEILLLGLVMAMAYMALTGYFPGGIIVPGYLVIFVDQPYRMAGTLMAALTAYCLYLIASKHLILFGRRRFVVIILLGAVSSALISWVAPGLFPSSIDYRVIGIIVPGLIAGNFERQGVAITTASMAIVVTLTWLLWNLWLLI